MNAKVKAVIDIGSNSIKLRIGRQSENGAIEALLDTAEVVQLGRGFINGGIANDTMQNALRVITEMVSTARRKGADALSLVGTMALRRASNAAELLNKVRNATGLDIRIISGEEEAAYSWKGAIAGINALPGQTIDNRDIVMFDTGGGSTEFVFGHGLMVKRSQSLPLGAVSLTEQLLSTGPMPCASLNSVMNYITKILAEHNIARFSNALPFIIGLGGGVIAMASVKKGLESTIQEELHGTTLTQDDLTHQVKLYAPLTLEERKKIPGLPPARANVILGSACIVLSILKALDTPSCTVSTSGLRHAVLLEMFSKE